MVPTANLVNMVTNLPKIKFISGKSTPEATAATEAKPSKIQLLVSAYLKIRYENVSGLSEWTNRETSILDNSRLIGR